MAEILAVTWGEEELVLRRVPSEGIWNKDATQLKRVSLQRPTRAGRLSHPEVGGALGSALIDLFADVDINVPCWLLLPNNWTLRFISEPPDLKSQELTLNYLRWESKQRISGDPADYKIAAALLMGGARYFICITRSEVIQQCLIAAESADLELAGIGLEPNANENYTFEHPLDLRDALALETESNGRAPAKKKKVSSAVIGIFFVAILFVGSYLMFFSGPPTATKPVAERAKAMPPREAVTQLPETAVSKPVDSLPAKTESVIQTPTETVESKTIETVSAAQPEKPISVSGSLFRGLFAGLPAGARPEIVVLSPKDLKVEASGVGSSDQWLTTIKKQPGWSTAKVVGNYETVSGRVTAIRVENPGWLITDGRPSTKWQDFAKSAGMSVKERVATGKLEAALTLLDELWQNSGGLSKVYLSPVGDTWQVVVQ